MQHDKLWSPEELAAREREVGIEPLEPSPREKQLQRLAEAPCYRCGREDSAFGEHDCGIHLAAVHDELFTEFEDLMNKAKSSVSATMSSGMMSSAASISFDPANPLAPGPHSGVVFSTTDYTFKVDTGQ